MRKAYVFAYIVLLLVFITSTNGFCYSQLRAIVTTVSVSSVLFNEDEDSRSIHRYSLIDDTGRTVAAIPFPYEPCGKLSEGCIPLSLTKISLTDFNGRSLIPNTVHPLFALPFENGASILQIDANRYTVLTKNGMSAYFILPTRVAFSVFESGYSVYFNPFDCQFGVVARNGRAYWADKSTLDDRKFMYRYLSPVINGYFQVRGSRDDEKEDIVYYLDYKCERVLGPFQDGGAFSEGLLLVKSLDGKSRYIDEEGNTVLELPEDIIPKGEFHDGLAPFYRGGKYGFFDKTGKVIIDALFDNVEKEDASPKFYSNCISTIHFPKLSFHLNLYPGFSNGFAAVRVDGEWGVIDKTGRFVVTPEWKYIYSCSAPRFIVKAGQNYGVVGTDGKQIVEPDFKRMLECSNGYFRAGDAKGYRYFRSDGTAVSDRIFKYASDFSNGLAFVNERELIDEQGQVVRELKIWERIEDVSDGVILARDKLYGFANAQGNIAIEAKYSSVTPFVEGISLVSTQDGLYEFIGTDGMRKFGARYFEAHPFSDGYALVGVPTDPNDKKHDPWLTFMFIDRDGKVVYTAPLAAYLDSYSEGLAAMVRNETVFYIDAKGNTVLDLQVSYVINRGCYSDGMLWIQFGRREFSLYNRKSLIGEFSLRSATPFFEGLSYAIDENADSIYIDRNGKIVIEAAKHPCEGNACDRIPFKDKETDLMGYLDYEGNIAINPTYKYVKPFSNDLASVYTEDNRCCIIDPNDKIVVTNMSAGYMFGFGK